MCRRVEMHFHNSDKLDLTANHRQQWLRTLRAVVCPTLQRGSTETSVCVSVPKPSHLGLGMKSLWP